MLRRESPLLLPLAEFTPRAEFTGLAAGATLPRRAALALGRLGALGAPRAEAAEGAWLVVSEAESSEPGASIPPGIRKLATASSCELVSDIVGATFAGRSILGAVAGAVAGENGGVFGSSGRGKVGNAAIRKTSCLLGRLGVLSSTESAVASESSDIADLECKRC